MKKFAFYCLSLVSVSAVASSHENIITFDNASTLPVNVTVKKNAHYDKPFDHITLNPVSSSKEYKYSNDGCSAGSGSRHGILKFAVSNVGNTFYSYPEISFENAECKDGAKEVDSWNGCFHYWHKCVKDGKYTQISYTAAKPNKVKILLDLPNFVTIKELSNLNKPINSFTNRCELTKSDQEYNDDLNTSGGFKKIRCFNSNGDSIVNENFKYYELCPVNSGVNVNENGQLECAKNN